MRVVDPHIHFWDLASGRYPWLGQPSGNFLGDSSGLAEDHLPADFRKGSGDIEVLKVVHIDAIAADPIAETCWLQSLADGEDAMPDAIVAYVDLSRSDADEMVAKQASFSRVRGIRQILNVHPDPVYDYVGRHFMDEPQWRANFRLLSRYDLSFDLQLYPSQMRQAAELAAENPGTQFAVNHTGMFADRGTPLAFAEWRNGMRLLAERPNIHVKISGLGMFDHRWTTESLRPYVLETIDAFGVDRAMFAIKFSGGSAVPQPLKQIPKMVQFRLFENIHLSRQRKWYTAGT